MRILAISGSLNAKGTITTFVRAIAALAPEGMAVTLYEGWAIFPISAPTVTATTHPLPLPICARIFAPPMACSFARRSTPTVCRAP